VRTSTSSSNGTVRARCVARTAMCSWAGSSTTRSAARIRRLARFRSTAEPTALPATTATFVSPSTRARTTVSTPRRNRRPCRKRASKSLRLVRLGAAPEINGSGADALAPLEATALHEVAAGAGALTSPTAHLALAAPIVGLEGALHDVSALCWGGKRTQRGTTRVGRMPRGYGWVRPCAKAWRRDLHFAKSSPCCAKNGFSVPACRSGCLGPPKCGSDRRKRATGLPSHTDFPVLEPTGAIHILATGRLPPGRPPSTWYGFHDFPHLWRTLWTSAYRGGWRMCDDGR
jgi:hypothetical protein